MMRLKSINVILLEEKRFARLHYVKVLESAHLYISQITESRHYFITLLEVEPLSVWNSYLSQRDHSDKQQSGIADALDSKGRTAVCNSSILHYAARFGNLDTFRPPGY